jgi:hypothetical protein
LFYGRRWSGSEHLRVYYRGARVRESYLLCGDPGAVRPAHAPIVGHDYHVLAVVATKSSVPNGSTGERRAAVRGARLTRSRRCPGELLAIAGRHGGLFGPFVAPGYVGLALLFGDLLVLLGRRPGSSRSLRCPPALAHKAWPWRISWSCSRPGSCVSRWCWLPGRRSSSRVLTPLPPASAG